MNKVELKVLLQLFAHILRFPKSSLSSTPIVIAIFIQFPFLLRKHSPKTFSRQLLNASVVLINIDNCFLNYKYTPILHVKLLKCMKDFLPPPIYRLINVMPFVESHSTLVQKLWIIDSFKTDALAKVIMFCNYEQWLNSLCFTSLCAVSI